jgi:tRNA-binding protein
MIIAVTNFPPKQVGQFMSEVLVLGVPNARGQIVLMNTDSIVEKGQRVI